VSDLAILEAGTDVRHVAVILNAIDFDLTGETREDGLDDAFFRAGDPSGLGERREGARDAETGGLVAGRASGSKTTGPPPTTALGASRSKAEAEKLPALLVR